MCIKKYWQDIIIDVELFLSNGNLIWLWFSGEDVIEVTPVPIPNTEVKLKVADDSWGLPPVKIGIRQILYIPL